MVSKLRGISVLFICMLMLSACSNSSGSSEKKSDSKSKNKDLEVSIEDASFVLLGKDDGVAEEETEKGILAVNFKLNNKAKESIRLSTRDGMKLYDGDEEFNAISDAYNTDVGIEFEGSGDLGAGKTKTVTGFFEVEKDKEYEIGVKAQSEDYDKKIEEVIIKVNTADYAESFDALQDPAKALAAYIDAIYLDKDNSDYEKFVSADKAALQEQAKEVFKEKVKRNFVGKLTDAEVDKLYATYKSAQSQKAEFKTVTSAKANGKAVVLVEFSTVSLRNIYEDLSDYQFEYREKTGKYDEKATKKYLISKFDKVVNAQDVEEGEDLKVLLVEEDGKWSVDSSEDGQERIANIFAAGSKY
ncbi:DUF5105 domain-containing protein [Peribacillus sp. NPDC097295]|uniref:DUF5105 domain-containing protein n=1 Tax=Peribacillus sp. NPDC097295 TaxID=3364402 RepID=UPI0038243BE2